MKQSRYHTEQEAGAEQPGSKLSSHTLDGILGSNRRREEAILSPCACHNREGIRRFPDLEKIPDENNIRPVFFHDSDKIIHSLAYARYVDKTQVFSLFENDHITHRALHVQFVSRIGRVIGRAMRLNEDLIEAISVGHDIGHTPFGHEGEAILNDICQANNIGLFAHNAQGVRFLMEVENRGEGLNLSLQVLDGILCHNGEMVERNYRPGYTKNWGAFLEEYRACFKEPVDSLHLLPMTLEGCVVRISDVIAYIGRDIEDAIRLRLIDREQLPAEITDILGTSNDVIINTLVTDLIEHSYGHDSLSFSPDVYAALRDLKQFNYEYIYKNREIKAESAKITSMFNQLFSAYLEDLERGQHRSPLFQHFLSGMSIDYLEKTDKPRIIVDFMAGMTDDFLYNQYKSIFMPRRFGYAIE